MRVPLLDLIEENHQGLAAVLFHIEPCGTQGSGRLGWLSAKQVQAFPKRPEQRAARIEPPAQDPQNPGKNEIAALTFDADGKRIAGGTLEGVIKVWSINREPLAEMRPPPGTEPRGMPKYYGLAFSGDGQSVLSATSNGIVVWDLHTGQGRTILQDQRARLGPNSLRWALAIRPGGNAVASGWSDKTVRIWDLARKQIGPALQFTNPVTTVAFSSDGQRLISIEEGGDLRLWSLDRGRVSSKSPVNGKPINDVFSSTGPAAISPNAETVYTSGLTVSAWSTSTGEQIASFPGGAVGGGESIFAVT